MINPVIFSFKLFNLEIVLRWYGVLVMFGAVVGAWIAEREIQAPRRKWRKHLGCA